MEELDYKEVQERIRNITLELQGEVSTPYYDYTHVPGLSYIALSLKDTINKLEYLHKLIEKQEEK